MSKLKQAGVSMAETLLVLPILLFLGFGIVHLGLVFQAQSNLEYAALMAARVGASNGIEIQPMIDEVERRMEASGVNDAPIVNIEVLNPSQSMFDSCGKRPTYSSNNCANLQYCEIPHYGLSLRDEQCGNEVSIQDANILRIRVTYRFNSGVPFLNRITFKQRFTESDVVEREDALSGGVDEGEGGVDVYAVATVRMQVPARRTFDNTSYIGG